MYYFTSWLRSFRGFLDRFSLRFFRFRLNFGHFGLRRHWFLRWHFRLRRNHFWLCFWWLGLIRFRSDLSFRFWFGVNRRLFKVNRKKLLSQHRVHTALRVQEGKEGNNNTRNRNINNRQQQTTKQQEDRTSRTQCSLCIVRTQRTAKNRITKNNISLCTQRKS